MPVLGPLQDAAAGELREWWEGLWQRGIGSQVVLLKAPPGWRRFRTLGRVAEDVDSEGAPVTVVIPIPGRELLLADALSEERTGCLRHGR